MSIDKDLSDRLMEGRSPSDLFGKTGILSELTKALAERALSTEMDVHLDGERIDEGPEGQTCPHPKRPQTADANQKNTVFPSMPTPFTAVSMNQKSGPV